MKAKQVILLLCLLLNISIGYSQKDAFDSTYYYIATALSSQNKDKAIKSADSLLEHAQTNEQRVKTMMLLATLYNSKQDFGNTIKHAQESEKLANKTNNEEWKIRIVGFLASTYRQIGLYEVGEICINKAIKLNEKKKSALFDFFINQELAFYSIFKKEYEQALNYLAVSDEIWETMPEQSAKSRFQATSLYLHGEASLGLNKVPEAMDYFKKGLLIASMEDAEIKGFIYQKIGELELSYQNFDTALFYLNEAKNIAMASDNFSLMMETSKSLSNYYKKVNSLQQSMYYDSIYNDYRTEQNRLLSIATSQVVEKLNTEKKRNILQSYYIIISLVVLLFISLVLFLACRRKAKRREQRYKEIVQQIRTNRFLIKKNIVDDKKSKIIEANKLVIPEETIHNILLGLKQFEESQGFLQKEILLSTLANQLNINNKYLSHVINNYKGNDFNSYVNELRIQYILDKLLNNSQYRNYKVSYLAEESGFVSHSTFSAAFKKITQSTPSEFISMLKTEE